MNTTINCPKCRGAKKVASLGWMFHDCKNCLGIGHIKNPELEIKAVLTVSDPIEIPSAPVIDKLDKFRNKSRRKPQRAGYVLQGA